MKKKTTRDGASSPRVGGDIATPLLVKDSFAGGGDAGAVFHAVPIGQLGTVGDPGGGIILGFCWYLLGSKLQRLTSRSFRSRLS